jgi:hypothetical protein
MAIEATGAHAGPTAPAGAAAAELKMSGVEDAIAEQYGGAFVNNS